jgi:hypothetical protein
MTPPAQSEPHTTARLASYASCAALFCQLARVLQHFCQVVRLLRLQNSHNLPRAPRAARLREFCGTSAIVWGFPHDGLPCCVGLLGVCAGRGSYRVGFSGATRPTPPLCGTHDGASLPSPTRRRSPTGQTPLSTTRRAPDLLASPTQQDRPRRPLAKSHTTALANWANAAGPHTMAPPAQSEPHTTARLATYASCAAPSCQLARVLQHFCQVARVLRLQKSHNLPRAPRAARLREFCGTSANGENAADPHTIDPCKVARLLMPRRMPGSSTPPPRQTKTRQVAMTCRVPRKEGAIVRLKATQRRRWSKRRPKQPCDNARDRCRPRSRRAAPENPCQGQERRGTQRKQGRS